MGTTILWAQQTVRSSCWSSMINVIRPVSTNKRFNSAYLQIKYLRKIHSNTFWLDKIFPVDHKSPWCCRQKDFLKTRKSGSDFLLGTILPSPPSKKKNSPWKIIDVSHSRKSGRGRRRGVIIILLKPFFFKIPDLVHRRTSAPVVPEMAARWRYRLPSNNMTAHYNSFL